MKNHGCGTMIAAALASLAGLIYFLNLLGAMSSEGTPTTLTFQFFVASMLILIVAMLDGTGLVETSSQIKKTNLLLVHLIRMQNAPSSQITTARSATGWTASQTAHGVTYLAYGSDEAGSVKALRSILIEAGITPVTYPPPT